MVIPSHPAVTIPASADIDNLGLAQNEIAEIKDVPAIATIQIRFDLGRMPLFQTKNGPIPIIITSNAMMGLKVASK